MKNSTQPKYSSLEGKTSAHMAGNLWHVREALGTAESLRPNPDGSAKIASRSQEQDFVVHASVLNQRTCGQIRRATREKRNERKPCVREHKDEDMGG